jgi:3-oxoacyl-[acyl-carrier protein] reductase
VAAVADRLGPVDVLVLNATGPQPEAPLAAVAWEDHVAQLDLFVNSPVLSGAPCSPGCRRSGSAHRPDRLRGRRPAASGQVPYATTKSAQIGLTRSRARELAPLGITVNTVAPGFIPVERHADVPDETTNAYLGSVPAGRMGTREDIAHPVGFFASEPAGSVTGQRLVVDGGRGLSIADWRRPTSALGLQPSSRRAPRTRARRKAAPWGARSPSSTAHGRRSREQLVSPARPEVYMSRLPTAPSCMLSTGSDLLAADRAFERGTRARRRAALVRWLHDWDTRARSSPNLGPLGASC